MCLLLVCSPNSIPKKSNLQTASCNNPHGFGYAIITPDGIITGKGMSAKKTINKFLTLRKQYPDSYAMFHARYATHGVKNEDNCHPFKVSGSPDTYLAHNGVLDVHINAGDRRSDTRVFAEDILPAMGGVTALDNDNVWQMVSKWASGSKVVIFTLNPAAQDQVYIINEKSGHWDNDGIWWSNYTYCDSKYWTTYDYKSDKIPYADDTYDKYEAEVCKICEAVPFEDANPYYCEMCMSCVDCYGIYGDTCLCWTPDRDKAIVRAANNVLGYYNEQFDF